LAYYIAACPEADYLDVFYGAVVPEAGVKPAVKALPAGVQATRRGDLAFVMNFSGAPVEVSLPRGKDLLTGATIGERETLPVNGFRIVRLSPEGES
jgi:beta-galactosidase